MKTKEKVLCSFCGKELTQEGKNEFDGVTMCKSCLEEKTVICVNCCDRIWKDDAEGNAELLYAVVVMNTII